MEVKSVYDGIFRQSLYQSRSLRISESWLRNERSIPFPGRLRDGADFHFPDQIQHLQVFMNFLNMHLFDSHSHLLFFCNFQPLLQPVCHSSFINVVQNIVRMCAVLPQIAGRYRQIMRAECPGQDFYRESVIDVFYDPVHGPVSSPVRGDPGDSGNESHPASRKENAECCLQWRY